ncbi:MAG: class I SAM-dependent methyltransferase [Solirubrobacterales bacterium]
MPGPNLVARAGDRVDALVDRLLARLLRRRLYRVVQRREREASAAASTWNPVITAAQEDLIRRYAPGRSFADIGCLWEVDGACAFLAEEAGASAVTAMDKWPPSELYLAEHARRGSALRFVEGDLHDPETVREIGVHDVIWCSGVLYHTPDPVLAIGRLLEMTGEYLIAGTKTLPSVPGLPGLAAYYPGLSERDRASYDAIASAVSKAPFEPESFFANWFWGLTPEALAAIARSKADVTVVEEIGLPWKQRADDCYLVLRRSAPSTRH